MSRIAARARAAPSAATRLAVSSEDHHCHPLAGLPAGHSLRTLNDARSS